MRSGAVLRHPHKRPLVWMTSTLASLWHWSPDEAATVQVELAVFILFHKTVMLHLFILYLLDQFMSLTVMMLCLFCAKGMRYKRRGVDTDGHVANYVETEQLIHVHSHTLSFVQMRGSVPVFWSQAGYRYNPRPRLEKGQLSDILFRTEHSLSEALCQCSRLKNSQKIKCWILDIWSWYEIVFSFLKSVGVFNTLFLFLILF